MSTKYRDGQSDVQSHLETITSMPSHPSRSIVQAHRASYVTPAEDTMSQHPTIVEGSDVGTQRQQTGLTSDNWFVHEPSPYELSRRDSAEISDDEDHGLQSWNRPQPLAMNPPTPPVPQHRAEPMGQAAPDRLNRSYTAVSTLSRSSTKSRYYGDLKAATQNLRPVSNSPSPSKGFATMLQSRQDRQGYEAVNASPRAVSRTGVDESDLGLGGGTTMGSWRRREVSGKVAEEGRGRMSTYR
jgi:hypothetical protein